jgi:malate dehydrogenase (oxaloacetate-decarboxylating)(NADP+)
MNKSKITDAEALELHAGGRPGKLEIHATKPLTTQRDLSLAYSPGVAAPCLRIAEDPSLAYEYTVKGNTVAVISNGSAVLGLGNLGALASKPVMEGKAVLFKRFADVDGIDIEVDTQDVDAFVNCVRYLGQTWGGINLEDITAPDCFIIEQRLQELLDIPVFHDDQHGTAIIATAGLINALHLTDRRLTEVRMVINGAGAAGIACAELVKAMGLPGDHVTLCDTRGVVYEGRDAGMNQWKSAHAVPTECRDLSDALAGADVVFGLSVRGAITKDMVASMAERPIIFAMANPDPEITPEEVREVRDDAIIATGRSDYPNQVNNVLGFPYIFRGALDVRATTINMEMKIAAAEALARLAREEVPDEVSRAYARKSMRFGNDYIIPAPFDPRLVVDVPAAVARAAIRSGVARKPIEDFDTYEGQLSARLDPTFSSLQNLFEKVRGTPRRVVFAEGEEETSIRAAIAFEQAGYGTPVLVGREERVRESLAAIGLEDTALEVHNARLSKHNKTYVEHLHGRLHRKGRLLRDCQRMVNQNRNVFAASMVACGHADAMVTGLTRSFGVAFDDIRRALDPKPDSRVFGLSIVVHRGCSFFLADTSVHELPDPDHLADIAIQSAAQARMLGHEPRVAFLSYSSFGNPMRESTERIRQVVTIMEERKVDFEFDGEMQASIALNHDLMREFFPFCRLTGPANVLIMPGLHSANIAAKLLQHIGGGHVIGPVLIGLSRPAQIVQLGATVNDLVTAAAFAAYESIAAE